MRAVIEEKGHLSLERELETRRIGELLVSQRKLQKLARSFTDLPTKRTKMKPIRTPGEKPCKRYLAGSSIPIPQTTTTYFGLKSI